MEIIISLAALTIVGLILANIRSYDSEIVLFGALISSISFLFLLIISTIYFGSYKTVNYLNSKHGTNYKTSDYFYNSSLIESELKSKNILLDNNSRVKVDIEKE